MNWARQALSRGNRSMAMWNIDLALSLVPTLEEGIRLKERLSGRPYWADYAQDSAIKYVVQRMIMQDLGRPMELVIPPGKPRQASSLDKPVQDAFGMANRFELPLGEATPAVKEGEDADVNNDGTVREGR
jgi:hypothetical protein